MNEMKVITKGQYKPEEKDGMLYMTVVVNDPSASIISAKRAVLECDANPYGPSAGIEKVGGIVMVKSAGKSKVDKAAMQFRLTKPIPGIGI